MFLLMDFQLQCAIYAAVLLLSCPVCANTPSPLSIPPSTSWYGDDGQWSAVSIRVGTPQQWMDVMVSTASAETWVVPTSGCDNTTICSQDRGGLFNSSASSSWEDYGDFLMGTDTDLGVTSYADYGLDILEYSTEGTQVPKSIIGQVTSTALWLGSLGVGIVPGSFNDTTTYGPIGDLANSGTIPSKSYGYTAGANYQLKGIPNSLTLGGYDANRLVPHNTTFHLNPSQQPVTYLDDIYMTSPNTIIPGNWSSNPLRLFDDDSAAYVTVDSTTPFLWLPRAVCERFADALGLVYNTTLNLYTFDANSTQREILQSWELNFTFSLKDTSTASEQVNITLPYGAFDLQLTFPYIPNTTYQSTESTKYYFPLRQAANDSQYTLGRSFLQEAYIITNYDSNEFSIHQAVHTSDPINNVSIVAINPTNSQTTTTTKTTKQISSGAIAGIVVGSSVALTILGLTLFFCLRKRTRPLELPGDSADKLSSSETSPSSPSTSLSPFLARLFHRDSRSPISPVSGTHGSATPTLPEELGADMQNEIYELPAPMPPAELTSDSSSAGCTGTNTNTSTSTSSYTHSQVQSHGTFSGMSHSPISPPTVSYNQSMELVSPISPQEEKSQQDVSPVAHYRSEPSTPISPLMSGGGGFEYSPLVPPPLYTRHIDPHNVVYVGRLPSGIRAHGIGARSISDSGSGSRGTDGGTTEQGTLGSGYTVEEEGWSPGGDGGELVHVPQLAERRFSWEEER